MSTVSSPVPTPGGTTAPSDTAPTRWPLERILFAMAGTVVLLSVLLAVTVSSWFLVLTALVGINQWAYVLFRACPASLVLARVNIASQCKW